MSLQGDDCYYRVARRQEEEFASEMVFVPQSTLHLQPGKVAIKAQQWTEHNFHNGIAACHFTFIRPSQRILSEYDTIVRSSNAQAQYNSLNNFGILAIRDAGH